MAVIGNAFDPAKAAKSPSYAYKCWFNYNYEKNTMRIPSDEMSAITEQYRDRLSGWKLDAERDVTEYSIEGSYEWDAAYNDGIDETKANVKDKTKYDGNTKKSENKNVANGVAAGATAAGTAGLAASGASVVSSTATPKGGCFVITCPLVLAVGILYEATAPNRKENKALKELMAIMQQGQGDLQVANSEMEKADQEIVGLASESEKTKAAAEAQIEEKRKLIEMAKAAYDEIVARVKSGEPLSSEDKSKLNICKAQIATLEAELGILIADSVNVNKEKQGQIEAKQAKYDANAELIATEKATTDFAASFDKATKDGAIVQAVAQGLNVAAGTYAAIEAGIFAASGAWAFGATTWAFAFMAMAIAGAAMSAHGVVEQSIIADNVSKEIDTREITENVIEDSQENYEGKLASMLHHTDYIVGINSELESTEIPETTLTAVSEQNSSNTETPTPSVQSTGNPFDTGSEPNKKVKDNGNPFIA